MRNGVFIAVFTLFAPNYFFTQYPVASILPINQPVVIKIDV